MSCDCSLCVSMSICVDCGERITGTRIYQREVVQVDLIHEEVALVGPRCESCAGVAHQVQP